MSDLKTVPRPRQRRVTPRRRVTVVVTHALLVIDHERLQGAAWAEFHTARKQLDRITRELHRHEEIDVPAFTAWLHRTYPLQVTTLRELNDEVNAKTRKIRMAQVIAATTGRSPKRVWREQQDSAAKPRAPRPKFRPDPEFQPEDEADSDERRQDARREDFGTGAAPQRSDAARDIYRRLVQRLHPDRGGAWSAPQQHLWHEVQQAWAAGDGDWLARLEVEWETAHEVVAVTSPLSRLRAAIEEVYAARRDAEAKLAEYRLAPQWRFTLGASRRAALARRVEADFVRDTKSLERQLRFLNTTIAAWEEDWTRADSRPMPRRPRRSFSRGRS